MLMTVFLGGVEGGFLGRGHFVDETEQVEEDLLDEGEELAVGQGLLRRVAVVGMDGTVVEVLEDGEEFRLEVASPLGGRKDKCWDNAAMGSVFSSLKTKLGFELPPSTREACHARIFKCIEALYSRKWLHSSIGYLSPDELERTLANK